jgi:predicted methyltransferase
VVLIGSAGCASSGGVPPAATQGEADHAAAAAPAQPAAAPAPPAPVPITPVDPATAPQRVAVAVPPVMQAIVDAPDRTEADRALDPGRHPAEMLAFLGVKAGMKVAEILAGSGYTSELLARAVSSSGTVYAVNNQFVLEKFAAAPWAERLARPAMRNVVRLDRELDDPLPAELKDLDLVVSSLVYHDTFWLGTDRDKMNAAIFRALKPGGVYAVIDHSGRAGTGSSEVMSLHRIEQSVVRAEIERAGFTLASEGNFLRNPQDARDWNDSPKAAAERRGTSDRFAMTFVKPK